MNLKIITFLSLVIVLSGCTNFAMLTSGAGVAVGNNIYAKAYSGIDILTIVSTEKDLKTHIYENIRHAH